MSLYFGSVQKVKQGMKSFLAKVFKVRNLKTQQEMERYPVTQRMTILTLACLMSLVAVTRAHLTLTLTVIGDKFLTTNLSLTLIAHGGNSLTTHLSLTLALVVVGDLATGG
jgi:hypothetical protein